ncbi:hypothetical protein C8Q78DRAFT_436743 [Trametes maxima]|nr:hypothetical protein C8Q78DRAFT_436743 [Trametes maxima]
MWESSRLLRLTTAEKSAHALKKGLSWVMPACILTIRVTDDGHVSRICSKHQRRNSHAVPSIRLLATTRPKGGCVPNQLFRCSAKIDVIVGVASHPVAHGRLRLSRLPSFPIVRHSRPIHSLITGRDNRG